MNATNFDAAALPLMLSNNLADKLKLRELAAAASPTCPECGNTDTEDNGATGEDLTFLCTKCGEQWEPAQRIARVLER
jgi:tRNA(Ile2) C34 agmatinyltransferase TiaS